MSASAHIDVKKTADLARLRLTPEEEAAYSGQLDRVLHYISQLDEVDTSNVEPAAHPHEVFDVTRPDEPREGFGVEAVLSNAPRRSGDQFMVPKVVE
ncbi:MAG TPA: Asp-tRNA(Asn)/Glu-tRNA(Gln) amidotransferase subunit GatC [Verrucomicrobiales bacterium]|jgi:aspartyl-tRNA(Asn)/glutamyl-tRNA(Gln) amidotransferase subunit C|nr:Asp-tRNA(Asn)/Glu-tRNA(Gln) amidotransferase subunit GatC [Verrucomicrobiales bacterium]